MVDGKKIAAWNFIFHHCAAKRRQAKQALSQQCAVLYAAANQQ